jgi:hypothetical protein
MKLFYHSDSVLKITNQIRLEKARKNLLAFEKSGR